jgi:hypothetical protein
MMVWPVTIAGTRTNEREREIFMFEGRVLDYGGTELLRSNTVMVLVSLSQELITPFSGALIE